MRGMIPPVEGPWSLSSGGINARVSEPIPRQVGMQVPYSAWPKKVFHQLYQDDILIFVMRRLEQSRVYATSQQGQSLQLQYLCPH